MNNKVLLSWSELDGSWCSKEEECRSYNEDVDQTHTGQYESMLQAVFLESSESGSSSFGFGVCCWEKEIRWASYIISIR